uniref:Squalene cyclase C-terminal domain-containing protein n=1 Tax=Chenopodium quinoa TaxID=63459 RepID=A0A803MET2_CHEQI
MFGQLRKGKANVETAKGVKLKDREVIGEDAVTITQKKAINFFTSIQAHDGHWPSDNAGPLYFMPPLNEDGGWGFHIDSHSTMFGSAISYIALRLLGEGPDDGEDNAVARGRQWILDHGGATSIPSWGKFWLSVLGVYKWDGCNPTPPELWLLPDSLPMHPELFDDVLIEREHVECTSSVIQAFTLFKEQYPDHRTKEIEDSISRGIQYIERAQNPDGSWYGFWGICFTYGTWFAVEALLRCNKNYHNSQAVRKACEFILSKQLPNGGWGESYLSSSKEVYTNLKGNKSNLVQTSWALLTLIRAGQWEVDPDPVDRGMRLVINSQLENGDFPPQETTGVFMKNCITEFSSYRCTFPIWVLSEYRRAQAQRSAIQ